MPYSNGIEGFGLLATCGTVSVLLKMKATFRAFSLWGTKAMGVWNGHGLGRGKCCWKTSTATTTATAFSWTIVQPATVRRIIISQQFVWNEYNLSGVSRKQKADNLFECKRNLKCNLVCSKSKLKDFFFLIKIWFRLIAGCEQQKGGFGFGFNY